MFVLSLEPRVFCVMASFISCRFHFLQILFHNLPAFLEIMSPNKIHFKCHLPPLILLPLCHLFYWELYPLGFSNYSVVLIILQILGDYQSPSFLTCLLPFKCKLSLGQIWSNCLYVSRTYHSSSYTQYSRAIIIFERKHPLEVYVPCGLSSQMLLSKHTELWYMEFQGSQSADLNCVLCDFPRRWNEWILIILAWLYVLGTCILYTIL